MTFKPRVIERKVGICPRVLVTLDISSSDTGVALHFGNKLALVSHVVKDAARGDYVDLLNMGDRILNLVGLAIPYERYEDFMVVVEQPFYVPGKSTPAPIYMMHGILLEKFYNYACRCASDFSWQEVNVSTWRNWLFKHHDFKPTSRKSKDQKSYTRELLCKHYNIDHGNDNAVDAAGIMLWLLEQLAEGAK